MKNVTKRKFTANFKSKIAIEVLKQEETLSQIASKYGVHPTQARKWKDKLVAGLPTLFEKHQGSELKEKDEMIDALYKKIGQREIELDWLKKKMESVNG